MTLKVNQAGLTLQPKPVGAVITGRIFGWDTTVPLSKTSVNITNKAALKDDFIKIISTGVEFERGYPIVFSNGVEPFYKVSIDSSLYFGDNKKDSVILLYSADGHEPAELEIPISVDKEYTVDVQLRRKSIIKDNWTITNIDSVDNPVISDFFIDSTIRGKIYSTDKNKNVWNIRVRPEDGIKIKDNLIVANGGFVFKQGPMNSLNITRTTIENFSSEDNNPQTIYTKSGTHIFEDMPLRSEGNEKIVRLTATNNASEFGELYVHSTASRATYGKGYLSEKEGSKRFINE